MGGGEALGSAAAPLGGDFGMRADPEAPDGPREDGVSPAAEVAAARSPDVQRSGRRGRRRWLWWLVAVVVAALALLAARWTVARVTAPVNPLATTPVLVQVRPGMRLTQIADLLRARGLVRSALAFRLLAAHEGAARSLQAGTYLLAPSMTPRQIVRMLAAGDVAAVHVTVPEGWDARQVVAGLADAGVGPGADLARAVNDPALLAAAGLPAPAPGVITALEGYLFPATYALAPNVAPKQAFSDMLQQFDQEWTPALAAAAKANADLNTAQAVTLASIVQREVGSAAEMPTVAGIYLNRLHQGMRLDADPTVLYALGVEAQNTPLTATEQQVDSPYNTYRNVGLPPGPICNPGAAALEAVAHPAATTALYFLTAPDGQLVLAQTLSQQLANRRKYLGY